MVGLYSGLIIILINPIIVFVFANFFHMSSVPTYSTVTAVRSTMYFNETIFHRTVRHCFFFIISVKHKIVFALQCMLNANDGQKS